MGAPTAVPTLGTLYRATDAERSFAVDWHGGQSTMLYAVASTGALSLGTHRPYWAGSAPMTDAEWARDLVGRLRAELDECHPDDGREHDVRLAWEFRLQRVARELEEID